MRGISFDKVLNEGLEGLRDPALEEDHNGKGYNNDLEAIVRP